MSCLTWGEVYERRYLSTRRGSRLDNVLRADWYPRYAETRAVLDVNSRFCVVTLVTINISIMSLINPFGSGLFSRTMDATLRSSTSRRLSMENGVQPPP